MRCDAGSCQYYLQLSSSNLFTKSNVCKFDPIPDVLLLRFNASSVVKNVFTAAGVKCQKQEHTVVILDLCNRMFDCTTVNLSFIKRAWKRIICLFCVRAPLRPTQVGNTAHSHVNCHCSWKNWDTLILPMLHIILFMLLLFLISGGGSYHCFFLLWWW